MDQTLLSAEAKAAYDTIYGTVKTTVYRKLKENGLEAFDHEDYALAISQLTQAYEASEEPDYEVMNRLAHAYRLSGNQAKADEMFQAIIDAFPGTEKADRAADYLSWNQTAADPQEAGGDDTEGGSVAPEEVVEDSGGDTGDEGNGDGEAVMPTQPEESE